MITSDELIELKVSNYNDEVEVTPMMGDDIVGLGDLNSGNDVFRTAQVKLIQLPPTVNVIQVPSNLLVANSNLILCLPPEGITLQLQSSPSSTSSPSLVDSDSLLEANSTNHSIEEISAVSFPIAAVTGCSQSLFTPMSPIMFTDIVETTSLDTTPPEVSPEVQLEKAQTWHKDSQLAIKALAALKTT